MGGPYFPDRVIPAGVTRFRTGCEQSATGIVVSVCGKAGISGVVRDEAGNPVAGAEVALHRSLSLPELTLTDASGAYVFEQLLPKSGQYPASYHLSASAEGFDAVYHGDVPVPEDGRRPSTVSWFQLGCEEHRAGMDFNLCRRVRVSGRIRDAATGDPVTNALVVLEDDRGAAAVRSDATGTYSVTARRNSQELRLRVSHPGAAETYWHPAPTHHATPWSAAERIDTACGAMLASVDVDLCRFAEVRGTVRDGAGQPVPGAVVTVQGAPGSQWTATSDTTGAYAVTHVVPTAAPMSVWVAAPGHGPTWLSGAPRPAGSPPADPGPGLAVACGETVAGVDFGLCRAEWTGQVRDRSGHPVSNALVRAMWGERLQAEVRSDATGGFRIVEVPIGTGLRLWVEAEGFTPSWWGGDAPESVRLACGTTVAGTDVTLCRLGSVAGTVRDDLGAVVAGAVVSLWDTRDQLVVGETSSSGTGSYQLGGLLGDRAYYVRAARAGHRPQWRGLGPDAGTDPGQPAPARSPGLVPRCGERFLTADIMLCRHGSVSGTVRDELTGLPIDGAEVHIASPDGLLSATTTADGGYRIDGVPVGSSPMHATAPSYSASWLGGAFQLDPASPTGTVALAACGEHRGGLDFALCPVRTLRGTVYGDGLVPAGGARVRLTDATGETILEQVSGADGTFRFLRALRGGVPYYLSAELGGSGGRWHGSAVWRGPRDPVGQGAAPIRVGCEGASIQRDFLFCDGGSIRGTVRDPAGQPLSGVTVRLHDPAVAADSRTTTLADGSYAFADLAANIPYLVGIEHTETTPVASVWYPDVPHEPNQDLQGTLSAIGAEAFVIGCRRDRTNVDFVACPGGSIRGTIHSDTGLRTAGTVWLYSFAAGRFVAADLTSNAGEYVFEGIAPGQYSVVGGMLDHVASWLGQAPYIHDDPGDARVLTVDCGAMLERTDIVLAERGEIEIRVVDEFGRPVPRPTVTVVYEGAGTRVDHLPANGIVHYYGFPSRLRYSVYAESPERPARWIGGRRVRTPADPTADGADWQTVPSGVERAPVRIVLPRGGLLRGRVTDRHGLGAAAVPIRVGDEPTVVTDADGRWISTPLAGGSYEVRTDDPRFENQFFGGAPITDPAASVPVAVGPAETRDDVDFVLASRLGISGRVVPPPGAGEIDPAEVALHRWDPEQAEFVSVDRQIADPAFRFEAPPGRYVLRSAVGEDAPFADVWHPDVDARRPASHAVVLEVGTNDLVDVDLRLGIGATMEGRVVGPDGAPGEVEVLVSGPVTRVATTDSNGAYRVGGLVPGAYHVRTHGADPGIDVWWGGWPVAGPEPGAAVSPVLVEADDQRLRPVDLTILETGTVSGLVALSDRTFPPQHARVEVFDESGAPLGTGAVDPDTRRYRVAGLPPGGLYLRALDDLARGEWHDGSPATNHSVRGLPMRWLAPGGSLRQDFRLDSVAASRASGRATIPSGAGADEVVVHLDSGGERTATPDPDGAWTLELPAGSHFVEARAAGAAPRWLGQAPVLGDPSADGAEVLTLQPGEHRTEVDIALMAGAMVHGMVRDRLGRSVTNTEVWAILPDTRRVGTAITDLAGLYRFAELPVGIDLALRAQAPGPPETDTWFGGAPVRDGHPLPEGAVLLSARPGGAEAADIQLVDHRQPGASLAGVVHAPDRPFPTTVTLLRDGRVLRAVETDSKGRFRFADLPPGAYAVLADGGGVYADAGPSGGSVILGPTDSLLDIDIHLAAGGWIEGVLAEAGHGPIPGGRVELHRTGGTRIAVTRPDRAGRFRFAGLAPGGYHVRSATYAPYLDEWNGDRPAHGDPVADGAPPLVLAATNMSIHGAAVLLELASPPLQLDHIGFVARRPAVEWSAAVGALYTVEFTERLEDPDWRAMPPGNVSGSHYRMGPPDGTGRLRYLLDRDNPVGHFRLKLVPQTR